MRTFLITFFSVLFVFALTLAVLYTWKLVNLIRTYKKIGRYLPVKGVHHGQSGVQSVRGKKME